MKLIQAIYLAAALSVAPAGTMMAQTITGHFIHTVTKGQSLYSVSSMYNVPIADIVKSNPGSDKGIKVGQVLRIPQTNAENQVIFHTIQPGETLYKLSVRHGVSVERICRANPGLSAKNFRIGQVIAIPPKVKSTEASSTSQVETQPVAKIEPTAPKAKEEESLQPKCRDMHKIKRKETVYSISRMYGITEEELIAANPEIKDKKLKKGKFLCIPYAKKATEQDAKTTPDANSDSTLTDAQLFDKNKKEVRKISTVKAAIVLPFNTDGTGTRDEQVRMVEYYEGFLMAVDSLKRKGVSVDLYIYDSGKTTASIGSILNKPEMKNMDIIFGPAHSEQVKPMADFAQKNHIRLVVPFSQKDEVFNNPYVFQVNTMQSYLYSEVYEHFVRKFPNVHVVFLDAETGHNDKDEFIKGLKNELQNKQISFKELKGEAINPEGMKLVVDSLCENVIIPTSGKSVVLTKVLPQLIITGREHPNYNMKLFGYPEWQTYTDDYLSSFFEMDTYFYSSFYTNNLFPAAIQFTQAYRKWFSKDMANTMPKYGMLGFDTAFFFLQGLHMYGTNFEDHMNQMQVTPIQTGFKFERVNNWGGFINRKVFFVNFTKNYELIKLEFE